MSIVNQDHMKILLPRTGPDEFWSMIADHFAGSDVRKWKYLAMLALRENSGWPLNHIGFAFKHPPGHVCRCLDQVKQELRDVFDVSFEAHDIPNEENS